MPLSRSRAVQLGALAALTLSLGACESGTAAVAKPPVPNIVASTQAWALVAKAVAGDGVPVAVVVDAGKDPHEYELSARDAATIGKASAVVMGGLHYDSFMDKALAAANGPHVIKAESAKIVSKGLEPKGHAALDNQHLFFNFAVVDAVAGELADELGREDPARKDLYQQNLTAFHAQLHVFADQLQLLAEHHPGLRAIQTESVGQYLLHYLSATDVTPAGYRAAVANEADPALADQAAVVGLLGSHGADLVVDNPQNLNKSVGEVLGAAKAAGVPAVDVGETPAPGQKTYSGWLTEVVGEFIAALGGPALPPDYHHDEHGGGHDDHDKHDEHH
ncbi:MAG: metal ABC transporter solute-binding protein, Zn/Mn family [Segniliparus sp.]|uniref:metal ABC transporter solute-binding protein, Zn/Mn family n=1 Tax=Segniliparus sp. TaxID=2804064 RepID=UPI003F404FDD